MTMGTAATALEATLFLAEATSAAGDYVQALDLIEEGVNAAGSGAVPLLPRAHLQRATALLGLGRLEECGSELNKGLVGAREQGLIYEEGLLLRMREKWAAQTGDTELEAESAAAALAIFMQLGARS